MQAGDGDGCKTIARELTHAARHKNRRLADSSTKNEFEAESEAAEKTAEALSPGGAGAFMADASEQSAGCVRS